VLSAEPSSGGIWGCTSGLWLYRRTDPCDNSLPFPRAPQSSRRNDAWSILKKKKQKKKTAGRWHSLLYAFFPVPVLTPPRPTEPLELTRCAVFPPITTIAGCIHANWTCNKFAYKIAPFLLSCFLPVRTYWPTPLR